MRIIRHFMLSVLAGIFIGIAGTVFLSVESAVLGSFLFSLGLFSICVFGFNLFTGQAGYIFENRLSYILWLCLTWAGNLAGTMLTAALVLNTRIGGIAERAQNIVDVKLNDSLLSIFILAVFCGILMYTAVNTFRKSEHVIAKYLAVILCVMVFILCGFEHCVANMYYFSAAGAWGSAETWLYLLIMTLGNLVGCFSIPGIKRIIKEKQ